MPHPTSVSSNPIHFALTFAGVLIFVLAAAIATPVHAETHRGPSITAIEITSTPAAGTSYATGETIAFAVRMNQPVIVTPNEQGQTPQLMISIGDESNSNRAAAYTGQTGSYVHSLEFTYTVAASDRDDWGVSVLNDIDDGIPVSPLRIPTGAGITNDAREQADVGADTLWLILINNPWQHRVNAQTPEPPVFTIHEQPGSARRIELEWRQPGNIDADSYLIRRNYAVPVPGAPPDDSVLEIRLAGTGLAYKDARNLIDGARYEYRITAYAGSRPSYTLPPVTVQYLLPALGATPTPALTPAPVSATATDHSLLLDWSELTAAGQNLEPLKGAVGYHIYRQGPGETGWTSWRETDLPVRSVYDENLRSGSRYAYKIFEDHATHAHRIIATVTARTMPGQ